MNLRRMRFLMVPIALGAVVTLAVTAYACTTVQGSTSVSPTSVAPGGTITATGSGALASHAYNLYFLNFQSWQDSMGTCMAGTGHSNSEIDGGVATTSDSSGGLNLTPSTTPNNGTIPSTAQATGTQSALVCWIDSGNMNATNSAMITVT